MSVFLNVDAGELPEEPAALYELADVVHVAAGGHAGDEASIGLAADLARRHGARFGAHPSYDDREGFGRRFLDLPPQIVRGSVARQCALVREVGARRGLEVSTVKPHGALYHASQRDDALAAAIVDAVIAELGEVRVVGPPEGALRDHAARRGLPYDREGFADRAYDENGQLRPRSSPLALLGSTDAAVGQALRLAASGAVETLCIHGDSPGAVALLRAVREALADGGLLRA